ncbi:hypothetical protein RB601_000794 [Gaeumannomyces tritici]
MMTSRASGGDVGGNETKTIVSFIDHDAATAYPGTLGGSSTYNPHTNRYEPKPHIDLLRDLSWLIPDTFESHSFQLEWHEADAARWEKLGEDIIETSQGFEASKNGFWHKIWYGMGDAKDAIDPWFALIPSDYGLAIVKAGVAVLFKLAENSKKRKQTIINTFTELREILSKSDPTKHGFSDEPEVRRHADNLYQAVVNSIRDMLQVMAKKKRRTEGIQRKMQSVFGNETAPLPPSPPSPDEILQSVTKRALEFQQAVSLARDAAIVRIGRNVGIVGVGVGTIDAKVDAVGAGVVSACRATKAVADNVKVVKGHLIEANADLKLIRQSNEEARQAREEDKNAYEAELRAIKSQGQEILLEMKLMAKREGQRQASIAARESARIQVDGKNSLLGILEDRVREQAWQIRELQAQLAMGAAAATGAPPAALLGPDQLWSILAGRRDRAEFSAQANQELARVLLYRGRHRPQDQAQANSALQHPGFRAWLAGPGPALLLVNTSLSGADPISAASVFAGTLVTSLVSARPDAVVVHFFCGLHTSPTDLEFGPGGLLRSVVMQLVLKLTELDKLDLGFLQTLQDVDELRSSEPRTACNALCQALCDLLTQFPVGTEVYCMLDSISLFDRERILPLLEILVECIQALVEDCGLATVFKVFLTNGGRGSPVRGLPAFQGAGRQISLSSRNSAPVFLSPTAMGRQILRPSTPTPETAPRGMSRLGSGGGYYEDDYDQGFETE